MHVHAKRRAATAAAVLGIGFSALASAGAANAAVPAGVPAAATPLHASISTASTAAFTGTVPFGLPLSSTLRTSAVIRPEAKSSLCDYYSSEPQIGVGSDGAYTEQAQCELNYAYAYEVPTNFGNGDYGGLTVDGQFGANTEAATKDFQSFEDLSVDGIIGPKTWAALDSCVETFIEYDGEVSC